MVLPVCFCTRFDSRNARGDPAITMGFTKYTEQGVSPTKTKWFTFDGLKVNGKVPRVLCVHAGDSNPAYRDDAIRKHTDIVSRGGQLSARQYDALRSEDADIFSRVIVQKWEDVYEDDKPAPFTPEKVAEFLRAIPSFDFDRLRTWAKDPETFREQVSANSEVVAKKLQP